MDTLAATQQDALNFYQTARREARKYIANIAHTADVSKHTAETHSGFLPTLQPELEDICREIPLPSREIPLHKIRGTYTAGRQSAFAGNFLPLLDPRSEFGQKWQTLARSAAKEGIKDTIVCYEYLGWYYVREGNKRVSVATALGAYSLRAEITRLLPPRRDPYDFMTDPDPARAVFWELLGDDLRKPVDTIWFSVPGRWTSLKGCAAMLLEEAHGTPVDDAEQLLTDLYARFRPVYHKLGLHKSIPEITTGDAFWQYNDIYGLPIDHPALKENLKQATKQFKAMVTTGQQVPSHVVAPPGGQQRMVGVTEPRRVRPVALLGRTLPRVLFCYCGTPGTRFSARCHDVARFRLAAAFDNVHTLCGTPSDGSGYEMMAAAVRTVRPHFVFATDITMGAAALRIALEFKSVHVLHWHDTASGVVNTVYPKTTQNAFLLGVAAGALTQTGNIGYLHPSLALGGRTQDAQAFAQGCRTTCANASVFCAEAKQRNKEDGILTLWAEHNIDLAWIPQFYGYPSPAPKVFPGVYASLRRVRRGDQGGVLGDAFCHAAWHYDAFYLPFLQNPEQAHLRLGMDSGVMDVHPFDPLCDRYVRGLLDVFRIALADETVDPSDEDAPVELLTIDHG